MQIYACIDIYTIMRCKTSYMFIEENFTYYTSTIIYKLHCRILDNIACK